MRKTRDYEKTFRGLWDDGGVCRVRFYEDEAGEAPPVVVISELPKNTNTSVTNIMENLAAEVAIELGVVGSETRFVEHYPRTRAELRAGTAETFDLVSFGGAGAHSGAAAAGFVELCHGWVGGVLRPCFGEPEWKHATREEVAAMIGEDIGGEVLPEPPRTPAEEAPPRRLRAEEEHGMLPPLPWDPESGDVVLERVPDFGASGGLDELRYGNLVHLVRTNVPWSVIEHSPDGFEWSYGGSGPADLALNILNLFEPPGADGQEPERCWDGVASRTARVLHQEFKERFIAPMPWEGGTIPGTEIRAWTSERVVRDGGGSVVGYVSEGARAG